MIVHLISVFLLGVLACPAASAAADSGAVLPHLTSGTLPLAETERIYLAEIEHRGLALNMRGWPAVSAAIRTADAQKIALFLSPTFEGAILDFTQGKGPQTESLNIRRITATGSPKMTPIPAKREEFAQYLQGLRSQFVKDAQVELLLKSLSPVVREKLEGAWKGSCALRIVGRRADGGQGETMLGLEFNLATVPDVDVITNAPGWVQALRVTDAQEAIAKGDLLAEVAKERGIDRTLFQDNWNEPQEKRSVVTGGVYVADIDNDGHDDLLVTDMRGVFLFRGQADGQFVEITEQAGLPRKINGEQNAAFADFDNDGFVDLLLDARLFRNVGGKHFEEVTHLTRFRFGSALGFAVADYDRDGKMDIYVSRSHGPKGGRSGQNSWIDGPGGPGNQLWRNLGNWQFEEVSQKANAQAGRRSTFTSCFLDVNNDGWPDIYVINEFGGGTLLVNQGNGKFKEQPLLDDNGDFGSMGMVVGDYDNDGNIDIYTANMSSKAGRRVMENLTPGTYPPDVFAKMKRFVTGSEMYHNLGGLKFERLGKPLRVFGVGWAYGTAFLDLDNDGFLDLYGTAGFMSVNKEEPDG